MIRARSERRFGTEWADRLQVKYPRVSAPVAVLSGGNQQKVVLAKWLARKPSLLIVDEPTRGIDVGTKSEVHRLISELASRGVAVLAISSELPEVLTIADRVLVMREGRLAAKLTREQATEEAIIAAGTTAPVVAAAPRGAHAVSATAESSPRPTAVDERKRE